MPARKTELLALYAGDSLTAELKTDAKTSRSPETDNTAGSQVR